MSPCGKKVAAVFSTSYFTLFDTDQLCSRFGDGQPSQPVEPKYRITDHSCTAFCWNPYDENVFAIGGNKGEVKASLKDNFDVICNAKLRNYWRFFTV